MPGDADEKVVSDYLSGGLDREASRAVEERAGRDAAFRGLLARMLEQDLLVIEVLGRQAAKRALSASRRRAAVEGARRTRPGRTILFRTGLAAAACAALAVGAWLLLGEKYPAPEMGAKRLARGAEIFTREDAAVLRLGGYARIEIEPSSSLRIEGAERAEAVYLQRGALACAVDRARGAFTVRTDVGDVRVTGTEFSVRVIEEEMGKRMLVKVLAGAVLVSGVWGEAALAAGEERAFDRPAWMVAARKALEREVSFEFVQAPLAEALAVMQGVTGVTLVVDRSVAERGVTPITLKLKDVTAENALKRIVELAGLSYGLVDEAIFVATHERLAGVRRENARRPKREAARGGMPDWERAMREKLARRVTFELVETPVSEAVQFLQTLIETTIILDPRAFEDTMGLNTLNTPVTLRVTNMPLRTALKWILRLADLDYDIRNNAVFVTKPGRAREEVGTAPGGGSDVPGREKPVSFEFVETPLRAPMESQGRLGLHAGLDKAVSFEFVETPLREAMGFLARLGGFKVTWDPDALAARGEVPITLKVADMKLKMAMSWILKLADAEWVANEAGDGIVIRLPGGEADAEPKPEPGERPGRAEPDDDVF